MRYFPTYFLLFSLQFLLAASAAAQSASATRSSELIASEEQNDYNSLKGRGIIEVDTAPYAAEWQKAYDQLRNQLAGKLFSKELLERVLTAAKSARK